MELELGNIAKFGEPFRMPTRQPDDPDWTITVVDDNHLLIQCGEHGIQLSAFNAARLVGALSLFLNIRLTKASARNLRL